MGLDMFLEKEIYVGAQYEHNKVTGTIDVFRNGKPISVQLNRVSGIIERVGYWRKANAIHRWFVENCQDGRDDCERYEVSRKQLMRLRLLCAEVLETKEAKKLPPLSGFFFGGTDIDEHYWKDLRDTIEIIDHLDSDGDYYYQSSW